MILLSEEHNFDSIIGLKDSLVLVDFYADWCEPCKWLDQILVALNYRFNGTVSIMKVDVERFTVLKERFNIRGIPVLMLFKNGVEVWRMNGFLAENELFDKIQSFR